MSEKKPVSRKKNIVNQEAVIEKTEQIVSKAVEAEKRTGFFSRLFKRGGKK